MHLDERLRVVRQVGVHAAEQAQLVGVPGHFGEQLGDPQPALAVLLELQRRAEQLAAAEPAAAARRRLAVVGGELRLVVERVDVAGPPSMHRKITRLAFAGKCGFFGASGLASVRRGPGGLLVCQRGEREVAEPGGGRFQAGCGRDGKQVGMQSCRITLGFW